MVVASSSPIRITATTINQIDVFTVKYSVWASLPKFSLSKSTSRLPLVTRLEQPLTMNDIASVAISGTAAGLAGVIDTSRVLSAQASPNDTALAFTVLAGIVVGGTSILGGEGAVWRTVVGVLFIALIGNGYLLLQFDPLYEQITMGVLLLAAVGLDAFSRRRR